MTRSDVDPDLRVPVGRILNPYANRHEGNNWKSVTELICTKEALKLRQEFRKVFDQVHQRLSDEELERMTNAPQYKVLGESWGGSNQLTGSSVRAVARLDTRENSTTRAQMEGWLHKKGNQRHSSLKRRYFILKNQTLWYFKAHPHKFDPQLAKGAILLAQVFRIQPSNDKKTSFAFDMITPNRTWVLQAQDEATFIQWLHAISHVVSPDVIPKHFERTYDVRGTSNTAISMILATDDTVDEIVEHIFSCHDNALGDPNEYSLKVTGFRDYLLDRECKLADFQYVRDLMLQRKTVRLSLVHKRDLVGKLQRSTSGYPPSTESDDSDNQDEEVECVDSQMISQPLRVLVTRVLGISQYSMSVHEERGEMIVVKEPLDCDAIRVRVDLMYGGQKQAIVSRETKNATLQPLKDRPHCLGAVFGTSEWIEFPVSIAELPITSRLVFTMNAYHRDRKQHERVATTGVQLFDTKHQLISGERFIGALSKLYDVSTGPLPVMVDPLKPIVHVKFQEYSPPIQFNWSSHSVLWQKRSVEITKSGWLGKLGSFKRFTKWRKRYFVLNRQSCTLSYHVSPPTSENDVPKGTIDLDMATIETQDDMNKRYTSFAVNKGTRKEQQTWCFKIVPKNSTREYIMSTESKQERQEWMDVLAHVAIGLRYSAENEEDYDDANSDASNQDEEIWCSLMDLIDTNPLYQFNSLDKAHMWKFRSKFKTLPQALPRFLRCVDWSSPSQSMAAIKLMKEWAVPVHRASYLELLQHDFAHPAIRSFAVTQLQPLGAAGLSKYLPQLTQALKFELYHSSDLACLLFQCAIEAPSQFGFEFFWCMKVESEYEQYKERYGVILNTYLDACSPSQRQILKMQDQLFSKTGAFARICSIVKGRKKDGMQVMTRVLHEELSILNQDFPPSIQLPIDTRIEVSQLVVERCRLMDSAKLPLWLVFRNNEGCEVTVIFKSGDDLRQDSLTLQLIRLMDDIWRDNQIDLTMEPYRCVATSPTTGLVQVVPKSITTAAIHKRYGGRFGAYKDSCFLDWIRENNRQDTDQAIDLFTRSCAGYCVATFLLGIGDRHNDNIMIASNGRYFHIDFGHFLGNLKYQFGIKRERTSFVLTKEMAFVMGGRGKAFESFVSTACQAYQLVRPHLHLFLTLFSLMIPAQMPELRDQKDLDQFVEAMAPELMEDDAMKAFEQEIYNCLEDRFKRFDNTIHLFVH